MSSESNTKTADCCGGQCRDAAAQDGQKHGKQEGLNEGGADLLYQRMDALGVRTTDVERFAGGMTAEMEKTCACCEDKGECRDDLAANPDDPNWKTYCPNSNALQAFKRLKGRFPI